MHIANLELPQRPNQPHKMTVHLSSGEIERMRLDLQRVDCTPIEPNSLTELITLWFAFVFDLMNRARAPKQPDLSGPVQSQYRQSRGRQPGIGSDQGEKLALSLAYDLDSVGHDGPKIGSAYELWVVLHAELQTLLMTLMPLPSMQVKTQIKERVELIAIHAMRGLLDLNWE